MSAPAHHLPAARPGRVRTSRYARWHLRDYFVDRGAPTLVIGGLVGALSVGPMLGALSRSLQTLSPVVIAQRGGAEAVRRMMLHDLNTLFIGTVLGSLIFLGALLAMQGIVAADRKQGYYRFLFSKPVSPARYYGQAFLLHWAGFMVVMCLLGVLYGFLVAPLLSVALLTVTALVFLCYAGVAFLLSAAARWDWLSLVVVATGTTFLWSRFGESPSVFAALLYLLPPLHRTSDVYSAVAQGAPLPWIMLAWFGAYGMSAFVAGLIVLRHRRLAII